MVELRPGVQLIDHEEGVFLLDVKKGVYWHLNESAFALLEALRQGRSFDAIVRDTSDATRIDEDQVRIDYHAVLDHLRRQKLIQGTLP